MNYPIDRAYFERWILIENQLEELKNLLLDYYKLRFTPEAREVERRVINSIIEHTFTKQHVCHFAYNFEMCNTFMEVIEERCSERDCNYCSRYIFHVIDDTGLGLQVHRKNETNTDLRSFTKKEWDLLVTLAQQDQLMQDNHADPVIRRNFISILQATQMIHFLNVNNHL